MEYLLVECEYYSEKVWQQVSTLLTRAIAEYTQQYVARINLTHLKIIFNKPHPSLLLFLTHKEDRMMLIILVQEIKRDILYQRMNLTQTDREAPSSLTRIQAHIAPVMLKSSRKWSIKKKQKLSVHFRF